MKITQVEAIEIRLPDSEILVKASAGQTSLIVKIHTDEGIVGIGEVDSCPRVAKAAIEAPFSHSVVTGLGRLLIGLDPLDFGEAESDHDEVRRLLQAGAWTTAALPRRRTSQPSAIPQSWAQALADVTTDAGARR